MRRRDVDLPLTARMFACGGLAEQAVVPARASGTLVAPTNCIEQSKGDPTMRITYDARADAAYVYLVDDVPPGGVAQTYPCDPIEVRGEINLDFDAEGRLLGIEVLDASKRLAHTTLRGATPI